MRIPAIALTADLGYQIDMAAAQDYLLSRALLEFDKKLSAPLLTDNRRPTVPDNTLMLRNLGHDGSKYEKSSQAEPVMERR